MYRHVTTITAALIFAPAGCCATGPATCPAELETNDKRFKETIEKLESVKNGAAQKCAAYRSYVEVMKRAIQISTAARRPRAARKRRSDERLDRGFSEIIKQLRALTLREHDLIR
jgi:hypothetical protein